MPLSMLMARPDLVRDHQKAGIDIKTLPDPVPLWDKPERIIIAVAGGRHPSASLWMTSSLYSGAMGSAKINLPAKPKWDALLAQAEKPGNDTSGKLRLFAMDARPVMNEKIKALRQGKVLAPDGSALTLPIQFEGGLSLIGYDLTAEPGKPIDLVVYLRVDQTPLPPRLAVFAHMLDESGQIVAQRDGLNVRLSSLEPGDVFLQHYSIERPDAARHLAIGLYDPATGQRMKTSQALDSIVIPLQP